MPDKTAESCGAVFLEFGFEPVADKKAYYRQANDNNEIKHVHIEEGVFW